MAGMARWTVIGGVVKLFKGRRKDSRDKEREI